MEIGKGATPRSDVTRLAQFNNTVVQVRVFSHLWLFLPAAGLRVHEHVLTNDKWSPYPRLPKTRGGLGAVDSSKPRQVGKGTCVGGEKVTNGQRNGEVPKHNGTPRSFHGFVVLFPRGECWKLHPGYGRWSRFLIDCADEYVGVDMNPNCVSACRTRFASASHATFVANDGKSLAAVGDDSIDFAFSFDSLVHVEIDVLEAYFRELSRKLSPDGVAFVHHSNLGEIDQTALRLSRRLSRTARRLPLADVLRRLRLTDIDHWRAPSVTSQKVADVGQATGLVCIGQELINWGQQSRRMIDCLSILTRSGSKWERPNVVVRNPYFVAEAFSAHAISEVYTT